MKTKSYTNILITAVLIILTIPALFIFIVDPLQLYHSQITLKKEKYFTEQRHQNIGLINKFLHRSNENYNTIILGSSLSENSISSEIEKTLKNKDKVLKLLLSGGQPIEYDITLKKALDSGKIKTVYWEINRNYMFEKILSIDKNHDFPYPLYSDSYIKKGYYYLFNNDYFIHSLSVFTGSAITSKWTEDLDKLNYWMSGALKSKKFTKYSSSTNIDKLSKAISKSNRQINKKILEYDFKHLDKFILDIIKQYPDVKFKIWFPPYSTYYYKTYNFKQVNRVISAKKYLVNKTTKMNNVTVYGFDNEFNITNNIYNYKDYAHYRSYINDFMIESMINNKHVLNIDNIENYLNNLISNINSYNKVLINKDIEYTFKAIDFNDIQIKNISKNEKITNNEIVISDDNINQKSLTILNSKKFVKMDGVKINFKLPKEKLKMISFSLNAKGGWAHFFIKPESFKDGIVYLTENTISRRKNFNFKNVKSLSVRLYPLASTKVTNFVIKKIKIIKKKGF